MDNGEAEVELTLRSVATMQSEEADASQSARVCCRCVTTVPKYFSFAVAMTVGYNLHARDLLDATVGAEKAFLNSVLLYNAVVMWILPMPILAARTWRGRKRTTHATIEAVYAFIKPILACWNGIWGGVGVLLNAVAVGYVVAGDNQSQSMFGYVVAALVVWAFQAAHACMVRCRKHRARVRRLKEQKKSR